MTSKTTHSDPTPVSPSEDSYFALFHTVTRLKKLLQIGIFLKMTLSPRCVVNHFYFCFSLFSMTEAPDLSEYGSHCQIHTLISRLCPHLATSFDYRFFCMVRIIRVRNSFSRYFCYFTTSLSIVIICDYKNVVVVE